MRRLWTELVRSRGATARTRRSRGGVALLLVVASLLVLTVIITDLSYGATIRFQVSTHQRDRVQAVWLARSGVNMYRLILTAGKQLEKSGLADMAEEYLGINIGDQLWQMIPALNTGLIRMIFASGGDADDISEEDRQTFQSTGTVSDEVREEAKESSLFSDRDFLDFDGDFSAEVADLESMLNVNNFSKRTTDESCLTYATSLQLAGLMGGEENDQWFHDRNLDKWELIANLADWVDADTMRCGPRGGYEDNLYNRGDNPYLSKNAPFDTKEEIRLVAGWDGEVYDRFGASLSVWGSGKININTASSELIAGLIRGYVTPTPTDATVELILGKIEEQKLIMGDFSKPSEFTSFVEGLGYTVDPALSKALTKSSQTFFITSTGLVNDSAAKVSAVVTYGSKGGTEGKVLYWRED